MVQARERKEAIEFVLHSTKEHDVKFIRLWFTDILGGLKGFAITAEEPVSYTQLTLPTKRIV